MTRNYLTVTAYLVLAGEFTVPFIVERLNPQWVKSLGPGGPYVAVMWLGSVSLVGITVGILATVRASHQGRGKLPAVCAAGAHALVFALPAYVMIRLLFHLY